MAIRILPVYALQAALPHEKVVPLLVEKGADFK